MSGMLIPLYKEGNPKPIPLAQEELILGRKETCDVCLPFRTISGRHCRLKFNRDGHWYVSDLNSRNGIMVNGVTVAKKKLNPGDILTVGRHEFEVDYRVKVEGAAEDPLGDASFSTIMRGVIDWDKEAKKGSKPKS